MTMQAVAVLGYSYAIPETDSVSEGTYVPEILLQILLPIVLILAYMVGDSPAAAAAPDTGKGRTERELRGQLAAAYLELQRQRLVAGLERVQAERKQELGLFYLSTKGVQVNPAGGLGDSDAVLVRSCAALQSVLSADDTRAAEGKQLFQRVLVAAGLTLGAETAPQAAADPVRASLVVTSENRAFLSEKIQLFLQSLETDTLREQIRLIDDVFRQYRDMPLDDRYRIVPETQGIEEQLAALNKQGKDITALADGLAAALYRKIKQDFESKGYSLLEQAWINR